MTDLRKTAEMALEALIGLYETPEFAGTKDISVDRLNRKRSARESIAALRQALAQPKQEPVDMVKIEHDKQVELAQAYERGWNAALAHEQEPVAWVYNGILHEFDPSEFATSEVKPLYTAPPNREWVGLTDEEILDEYRQCYGDDGTLTDCYFARAIIIRFKGKNGG